MARERVRRGRRLTLDDFDFDVTEEELVEFGAILRLGEEHPEENVRGTAMADGIVVILRPNGRSEPL